jgi:hypothetical protein
MSQKTHGTYRFKLRMLSDWLATAAVRTLYTNETSPYCRMCPGYELETSQHIMHCNACPLLLSNWNLMCKDSLELFGTADSYLASVLYNLILIDPAKRHCIAGLWPRHMVAFILNAKAGDKQTTKLFLTKFHEILLNKCYENWKRRSQLSCNSPPKYSPATDFALDPTCRMCWFRRKKDLCKCKEKIRYLTIWSRGSLSFLKQKLGLTPREQAILNLSEPPPSIILQEHTARWAL